MRNVGVQRVEGFVYPVSTQVIDTNDLPKEIVGRVYLYKLTCLSNDKVYIGQTNNLRLRFWQYRSAANRGIKTQVIQRAILKYGFENFSFEQIVTCQNQQDADELEILLIQQYQSHASTGKGYNVEWGGKGENAIKSEETCRKISEGLRKHYAQFKSIRIGGKHTEQAKRNMSIASMGKAGTNTGKTFPDEWRLKIAKILVGKENKKIRLFSESIEAEICKLYVEDQQSTYALGPKFGCQRSTITTILKRNGVVIRPSIQSKSSNGRNIFTKEQEKEICELYKGGKISMAELSRNFGCQGNTIRSILLRHDVKL